MDIVKRYCKVLLDQHKNNLDNDEWFGLCLSVHAPFVGMQYSRNKLSSTSNVLRTVFPHI